MNVFYDDWRRLFSGDETRESVTAKFTAIYGYAPEYVTFDEEQHLWWAGPVKVTVQEAQQ